MRVSGLLKYAMRALTERKLRAALTVLGIVIGPATIVSLVGATQGYSNASTAQFSSLGATTLFVSPVGRSTTLTSNDVSNIEGMQGVASVVPYQEINGQVTEGGETVSVQVVAVNLTALSNLFSSLKLSAGTIPGSTDVVGAAIGHSIAYPDIPDALNTTVGQVITVSGLGRASGFVIGGGFGTSSSSAATDKFFTVDGIYGEFGQSFGITPDTSIFIPLQSGEVLLQSQTYTGIMVGASSPSAVSEVSNELTAHYGQNVRVTSITSLLASITSVTQGTATLLEAVAGTSVLVAFIGIMTTMLTSVLERTKEIGVLKALGATRRGIMMIFLSEAAVTGLLGGLIGVGVGYALSFVVIGALSGTLRIGPFGGRSAGATSVVTRAASTGGAAVARGGSAAVGAAASSSLPSSSSSVASATLSITPAFTPELILLAILLAVAVGTFGGLIPAWRASKLNAVEALRRS